MFYTVLTLWSYFVFAQMCLLVGFSLKICLQYFWLNLVFCAYWWKWRVRCLVFKLTDKFCCFMGFWLCGENYWSPGVFREELNCICILFWYCVWYVDFITSVLFKSWSYVTYLDPMFPPYTPSVGFLMDYDLGSWYFQMCYVVLKCYLRNGVQ